MFVLSEIITHGFNVTGLMVIQIWEYQQPDVPSHQRQLSPMKASGLQDRSRLAVDEARGQWLQSEERAKVLSEKLSNALGEITSKDNLVKQHVKVAEEAVSGMIFPCLLSRHKRRSLYLFSVRHPLYSHVCLPFWTTLIHIWHREYTCLEILVYIIILDY